MNLWSEWIDYLCSHLNVWCAVNHNNLYVDTIQSSGNYKLFFTPILSLKLYHIFDYHIATSALKLLLLLLFLRYILISVVHDQFFPSFCCIMVRLMLLSLVLGDFFKLQPTLIEEQKKSRIKFLYSLLYIVLLC